MTLIVRLVFGIAITALMVSSDFRQELFDRFHREAMKTVSKGLTPMSDIVAGMRGGELKDSWLKPIPEHEVGSAMRGVPPMTPPRN